MTITVDFVPDPFDGLVAVVSVKSGGVRSEHDSFFRAIAYWSRQAEEGDHEAALAILNAVLRAETRWILEMGSNVQ